ncbi:sensor histidine kinase [Spongiactinospora sp. TRM90649]|uniref:sensor histidine kinase n=1 Tax=Spongiactinospora sp. TRM90649 TaxID=3031114 RepID=UPI0023F632C1|nr:sensor histidine kinase [Spongiactinospora sp. TRM90649]MDF5757896.1 sensor histidine kinase [Spongiactinospora sp. TRM90649]
MQQGDALDLAERRLAAAVAVAPYLLLVVSTGLSWVLDDNSWSGRLTTLGLALLAAAWLRWALPDDPPRFHDEPQPQPQPEPQPEVGGGRRAGVYIVGLLVLIGLLSARSAWFAGFFGFTGYLHAWALLRGRWRIAGVSATAAVVVAAFFRGLPDPTPASIFSYLALVFCTVVLVVLFSKVGDVTAGQSSRRQRMVARLAEANARLEETMRENAGLQAQLLLQAREAGITDERQRMAREIHDTLAQGFIGILTQIQAASLAREDPATWQRHLDNAAAVARHSLAEARRSVHAVAPAELESARLPEALSNVAARWSQLNGVRADVTTSGDVRPLHPEVEVTLLRITQEALSNVAKHADATRVGVTVSYMPDVVSLDVRDDGTGFDPDAVADGGGFGMTSMRQRAGSLSGTLVVESEPGAGTAVSATVPAHDSR